MSEFEATTTDHIVARSRRTDRLTLISYATRPGLMRFLLALEWEYFSPRTPRNVDFEVFMMNFEGLVWLVLMVPLINLPDVRRVASSAGLRLANGVPTCVDAGLVTRFPIDHPRAWTLENDPASPVYLDGGEDFVRAEERRWIAAFKKERGFR